MRQKGDRKQWKDFNEFVSDVKVNYYPGISVKSQRNHVKPHSRQSGQDSNPVPSQFMYRTSTPHQNCSVSFSWFGLSNNANRVPVKHKHSQLNNATLQHGKDK
jgi:hypothetical protein